MPEKEFLAFNSHPSAQKPLSLLNPVSRKTGANFFRSIATRLSGCEGTETLALNVFWEGAASTTCFEFRTEYERTSHGAARIKKNLLLLLRGRETTCLIVLAWFRPLMLFCIASVSHHDLGVFRPHKSKNNSRDSSISKQVATSSRGLFHRV